MTQYQIGIHTIGADELRSHLAGFVADGWQVTRNRHGNWLAVDPIDDQKPRGYYRIVTGDDGRMVYADTGQLVR
jgi:hypothetical protein